MSELLKVRNLKKANILNDINFSMQQGEMIAVMGPSGSGKSTLLYNISGMDRADEGEIILDGIDIAGMNEDERAAVRLTRMGFVFQQMNMLSGLNLLDNIVLPAVHADPGNRRKYYMRAAQLMETFHIGELAGRKVNEVSGGQLQRACICRSLILEPDIIFADEPTGALNQAAAAEVMDAFLRINRQGTSVLMVTHDSRIAGMCERILYILDGSIKGELTLGKYTTEDAEERGKKTDHWLKTLGW